MLLLLVEVLFVFDWWSVFERAVESVGVVPREPFEHRGAGFGSRRKVLVVNRFAFERSEERFGHGIDAPIDRQVDQAALPSIAFVVGAGRSW